MFLMLPIMIMNSLLFMMFKHPLSCGLILLNQTILTSLITGLMNYNFWYSYILFLIMIGGMLILFIYMTSIASNEKFKINYKLMLIMIPLMIMIMMLMIDPLYFNYLQINNLKINKSNNFSMVKYFNFPNFFIMLTMIIYLFITLIVVVKITYLSYGPLRQKF